MMSTAKTNLRMVVDTQLLALQHLDHQLSTCMTIMPGISFFDVMQRCPERRVVFLSHFLPQGLTSPGIVMRGGGGGL